MGTANARLMEPELQTMLARHREELLRGALTLAVRRASLDELVERPLGERLDELELLFEAASPEPRAGGSRAGGPLDLQTELHRQLDLHRRDGRGFSVAVVVAGRTRVARLKQGPAEPDHGPDARAWADALRRCAEPSDLVIDAGDGAVVVVLPGHDAPEARVAADRLCRAAWRLLGEAGTLADAGVATFPDDGASATEILAAAYDALWRRGDSDFVVNERRQHGPQAPPTPFVAMPRRDPRAGSGGPRTPSRHPLRPL